MMKHHVVTFISKARISIVCTPKPGKNLCFFVIKPLLSFASVFLFNLFVQTESLLTIPVAKWSENDDFCWVLKSVKIKISIYWWVQAKPQDLDTTIVSAVEFYPDIFFPEIFEAFLWSVETLPGLGVISRAFKKKRRYVDAISRQTRFSHFYRHVSCLSCRNRCRQKNVRKFSRILLGNRQY